MNKTFLKDNKLLNSFTNTLRTHGSTASMVCGLVSFGCALYAAFKASKEVSKTADEFAQAKAKLASEGLTEAVEKEKMRELKTSRNIHYILAYRWVALFGLTGTGLIILTKVMDGAAIASWAALAASQKDKLEKLGENAKKFIGEEKFKELEDQTKLDVAIDKIFNSDGPSALKVARSGGDVIFDATSSALFQERRDDLIAKLEEAKKACSRNHKLSTEELYTKFIGIQPEDTGDYKYIEDCWWGPKRPFDYTFDKQESHGCVWTVLKFPLLPSSKYDAGVD